MSFSEDLRSKVAPVWDREKAHPFVRGIGDGNLALERFAYYMRQDYIYLVEYCRVLALAVAKAASLEDMGWFARLLHETLNTEMELHREFCREIGVSQREMEQTRPSPTTVAYTSHLTSTAYSGGLGQLTASILPCQWGYSEIGQTLADVGAPPSQPHYSKWIEMYSSPEFSQLSDFLRGLLDRIAKDSGQEERRRMEQAFLVSSRFEYLFWDAAYRMEEWPV